METADLLTLQEVADMTRVPPATLRYWRHTGEGPASFKVGRRVVYRRAVVDAWLTDQETAAASPTVTAGKAGAR